MTYKYLIKRYFQGIPDFKSTSEIVESELDTREFSKKIVSKGKKPFLIEVYKLVSTEYFK